MKGAMLRVGVRYGANLVAMVTRQQGLLIGALTGMRYVVGEVAKMPKVVAMTLDRRNQYHRADSHPTVYSQAILQEIAKLGVDMVPYHIDADAFRWHSNTNGYPRYYAGGPVAEGGAREKKLLEYFVSFDLLAADACDTIIDVASEWSIFPDVLRRLTGAHVYRQDLIYPAGIHGDRIGGSAAQMPVPDGFATKLVLHNAYEHFEGTADSDFIVEAWRVLKPGGLVCILPLYTSDEYCILTDPLVKRTGVVWDAGARIVEMMWHHNRFGRFYSPAALQRRVLTPARQVGFKPRIYHVDNVRNVVDGSYLHFALVLQKPVTAR